MSGSETRHQPITTIEEFDALDSSEVQAGYADYEKGDFEPGLNHSRSYHHGWRMSYFDHGGYREDPAAYTAHLRLVRQVMDRERVRRGEAPRVPWPA